MKDTTHDNAMNDAPMRDNTEQTSSPDTTHDTTQDTIQDTEHTPIPLPELQGFIVGPLYTNCYLYEACDNGKRVGIIIDAGDQGKEIAEHLPSDLEIRYIVSTHGHNDHTGGVACLKRACGAKFGIHAADEARALHAQGPDELGYRYEANAPQADFYLEDGMVLDLGSAAFRVMEVPGHTPGSVFFIGEGAAAGLVFTGDVLFKGSIGRCDLMGGDPDQMDCSLKKIVATIDPQAHIFPGHGDPSRMFKELKTNPFLQHLV